MERVLLAFLGRHLMLSGGTARVGWVPMYPLRTCLLAIAFVALGACSSDISSNVSENATYFCKLGAETPTDQCLCGQREDMADGEEVRACPVSLGCCLRGPATCGCFDLAYANGRPTPGPGDAPLLSCQELLDNDHATKSQGFRVVGGCTTEGATEY